MFISPTLLLFSESEPSVERTGATSPPVRSDLRASAVLRADPDPHLLGLPDHHVPVGPTAALVLRLDPAYRVSTCSQTSHFCFYHFSFILDVISLSSFYILYLQWPRRANTTAKATTQQQKPQHNSKRHNTTAKVTTEVNRHRKNFDMVTNIADLCLLLLCCDVAFAVVLWLLLLCCGFCCCVGPSGPP